MLAHDMLWPCVCPHRPVFYENAVWIKLIFGTEAYPTLCRK